METTKTDECPYCHGLGYDASGQRCDCNETIQYVPIIRWRIAMESVVWVVLYLLALLVIIGPTFLMALFTT